MGNVMETLYDLISHPRTAFGKIAEQWTLRQSLAVVALSTLLTALAGYSESGYALLMTLQFAGNIMFWGISSAIWHLMAELLGGRGEVKQLMKCTGAISFIQVFMFPVCLIAKLFFSLQSGWVVLAAIGISVWSLYLIVLAIATLYGCSTVCAVVVVVSPVLIVLGFAIVFGMAAGSFFSSIAGSMMINPPTI